MNRVTLPPSPNWYLSGILSCAKDGTVAWGARNCIVVGKPSEKSVDYNLICDAHTERVTCLSFSPEYGDARRLVASGGDEHIVRIWNVDTMSAVSSASYANTDQRVVGLDWSRCDSDLICFVSSDGLLVSWNVSYDSSRQISLLPKMTATCIACSPHKSDVVAVGAKNGLIYIVNLGGNGSVVYKLRGHDVEITSLSWCPSAGNVFDDTESKDSLLASGAKDRSVFVWRAGGDGRCQIEIALPTAPLDSRQHRVKLNSSIGNWTAVCWASPKRLLASSSWGELIAWDLTSGGRKKPVCKLLHASHARGLFSIVAAADATDSADATEEENWRNPSKPITVWTVAQDRRVIRSSVTSTESAIEYSVPTQGGYVYCVAACPLDTTRIAFGVGDAMLRLWNLSEPHETTFDVVTFWQKIMGKVRAIAWHPEKENLLAFGTGEGRVGVWDVNTTSKPPMLYRQYHRHTVYSLGWGPRPDNENIVLYSCGDGELVYYETQKGGGGATGAKSVIKKECTEFAWKPDNSCLAVGFENGSVSFFHRNLMEIGEPIHSLKKAVQCLAWHPDSTATDSRLSPFRNYLAIATNSSIITIFDLSDLLADEIEESSKSLDEAMPSSVKKPRLVATLSGHADKVVSLAWSSHLSGHLVSGSYDRTAQVWKIETQQPIATYTGHTGPVQSCLWSPLDPDYIITGSSDFTIRVWKISDQKVVIPTAERCQTKRVRTKKSKKKTKITCDDTENKVVKEATAEEDKERMETTGITDSPKSHTLSERMGACAIDDVAKETSVQKIKKDRTKKGAYLPAYSKRFNDKSICLNSIRALAKKQVSSQKDDTANGTNDGDTRELEGGDQFPTVFGDPHEISTILEQEQTSHANQHQYNLMTEMSLWNNGLRKNLQLAVKEKRLNDFMVSLASSLSMKTWQEMCEAYAMQLIFESNPTKAVSYFLCIHKIHRAVQVFLDQRMYKEAYILAKCKLDSDDPILSEILKKWASNAARDGNFEDVAQCYIKLGDFAKAAKYLGRRRDSASLEVAAELGVLSEEPGLAETLADQAFSEALLNADSETARKLVDKFPQIQHRQVQIIAFDELKRAIGTVSAIPVGQQLLDGGSTDHGLLDKLCELCQKYTSHYSRLLKDTNDGAVPENERMLWLTTSRYMALAAIAALPEQRISHVVSALGTISQYEFVHSKRKSEDTESRLLIRILSMLESIGPANGASAFAVSANKSPVYTSLRAFLCFALLNWLVDDEEKDKASRIEYRVGDDVVPLIGKLLPDALDERTVKYWTTTNRVSKLEASLALALGKSLKGEDIQPEEEAKNETTALVEELDRIRGEKKLFDEERVCAPSPILVYSKATELLTLLPDGETKDNFARIVSEAWTRATSQ